LAQLYRVSTPSLNIYSVLYHQLISRYHTANTLQHTMIIETRLRGKAV